MWLKKLFSKQYIHDWEDISFRFMGVTFYKDCFKCKKCNITLLFVVFNFEKHLLRCSVSNNDYIIKSIIE